LDEHIAKFHGHNDSTTLHITSFMKVISDFDVVHEDVMMKMFALTLEDFAEIWFENLGRKEISSFAGLIKAFHKHWDPSYEEEERLRI
jgi:hypothetical protein